MTTTRGTYRRTAETRATIIAAAWQVMLERGFYGMSIALVAERSDMTRAGLMYHFPTKEHLLLAVMESRFKENNAWFREQAELGRGILESIIEFAQRRVDDPETVTLLMVLAGASIDPANPAHQWYVDHYELLRENMTRTIQMEQKSGTVRSDMDAELIAIQLTSLAEGVLLQWLNDPEAIDLVAFTASYCDLFRPQMRSNGCA